jgi:hypothetical protein
MSGTQKKSFASFLRTPPEPPAAPPPPTPAPVGDEAPPPAAPAAAPPAPAALVQLAVVPTEGEGREVAAAQPSPISPPAPPPDRVRHVTATGRVRTHSANRQLPGVTLRLPEERWERLKMLSIQERRPIQEILGDAMDAYMRGRGLPW